MVVVPSPRPAGRLLSLALIALSLGAPPSVAQEDGEEASFPGAVAGALASLDEDTRVYNDHVVTLASPFMEGRVPGSRGMEIATEYMEYWLRDAGLEPAFDGGRSWRQPFDLAAVPELVHQALTVRDDDQALVPGTDFSALALGGSGSATGELVFVGYSVEDGPDGYDSFVGDVDLAGKVVLMLRFEPMTDEGKSRWSNRAPWSNRASFNAKFRAIKKHDPAAVLLVNTPGAADPRVDQLMGLQGGGGQQIDGPVLMLTPAAGDALLGAVDPSLPTLRELREMADLRGGLLELGGPVTVAAEIKRDPLVGENVGGLLPGKGALADELLVIGAHLDHLGMGWFGSRSGSGELHPGADDNASGSAAVLMLAEKLAADYAALPDGAEARSILFLGFSGEESGLNGSRHYVENPIVPMDQHALMVNFDMIGRIVNRRLSVSGAQTAAGLADWLAPYFERSDLEIVQPANLSGASDHTAFLAKDVPVLFGIIADFHGDYHTPRDVSWKINREDAVRTVHLFHEIGLAAGTRAEPFEFTRPEPRRRNRNVAAGGGGNPEIANLEFKVRFGIAPGAGAADGDGVLVGSVSEGTSASEAGVEAGDLLTTWNGKPIGGVMEWMQRLAEHDPGDKVQVGVRRDGEELVLWVTLKARETAGG